MLKTSTDNKQKGVIVDFLNNLAIEAKNGIAYEKG